MDAGSKNLNEREGEEQHGMNREGSRENKNKIKTLDTERCETIDTLYINMYAAC